MASRLPSGSQLGRFERVDVLFRLSAPMRGETDAYRLYLDSILLDASANLDDVITRLESELHFQIALRARTALFVHAGVVGWRGRAILVPGRSRSGKTSLVAALARAGAEYYSDEYAVVDSGGYVHPYAKPLSIRGKDGVARSTDPKPFGARVGSKPIRAGLIVSTHYSPGAQFQPTFSGPGRGLLCLIDNTVVVRERPRFALDTLTPVAHDAQTLEGVRGEAADAATLLTRHLDGLTTDTDP